MIDKLMPLFEYLFNIDLCLLLKLITFLLSLLPNSLSGLIVMLISLMLLPVWYLVIWRSLHSRPVYLIFFMFCFLGCLGWKDMLAQNLFEFMTSMWTPLHCNYSVFFGKASDLLHVNQLPDLALQLGRFLVVVKLYILQCCYLFWV